ncbi:MAG: formylglycine-generating enzyme family protein [Lentimicrobiaceae bacterium]|jgi:formylglycine-generating enzyme required for sulfatase activity|nr:formylglycine-generating enzyme family protein [Lentimicrobiaceae bacterium]
MTAHSSQTAGGQPDDTKDKFFALSPTNEAEDIKVYSEALDWALDEERKDRVRNIALAGPYGSGKSSILKTYDDQCQRANKNLKFLYISLARFNEKPHFNENRSENENTDRTSDSAKEEILTGEKGEKEKSNKSMLEKSKTEKKTEKKAVEDKAEDKEKLLRLIELSILQQLFYRKSKAHLPLSRFKKIDVLSKRRLLKHFALAFAFLFSLVYVIHPCETEAWLDKVFFLGSNYTNMIHYICLAIVLITVMLLMWILIKHVIPMITAARFNFKHGGMEAGIEIDPENMGESILNKHLDEILYFFEETDYNVVVIEDLDRFETTDIFVKLRELNSLINEYEQIKGKHKVIFIYAVCDNLFKNKEMRTKFFDFIISVIPVVSVSNAGEELEEVLKDDEKWSKEERQTLLRRLSPCVDDMRLLLNTANEYKIYYDLNEKEKLMEIDRKKLFSLILYKNSYPDDFELLRRNPEKSTLHKAMKEYLSSRENTEKAKDMIAGVVKDEKQRELLTVLLINAYIDESYSFYINRGTLSQSDLKFFSDVSDGISPGGFYYPLTNIEALLEKLTKAEPKVEFGQECMLNFHLVDYLLARARDNGKEWKEERTAIFQFMARKSKIAIAFVNGFITRDESDIEQFVKEIIEYWRDIAYDEDITESNRITLQMEMEKMSGKYEYDTGKYKGEGKYKGKYQKKQEQQKQQKSEFEDFIEMIEVKGGTFRMGGTEEQGDDCFDDERPVHEVTLNDFKIGKYPVTQAQWARIMGNNPSWYAQGGEYPVENVSWHDAQEFCERLNAVTGEKYRLPTEAEWEYAARGGNKSEGYKYSGSNDIDEVAWYGANSKGHTHLVGKKKPVWLDKDKKLGIYDMSGNVYEWCSDWYGGYPATPQKNPQGPLQGSNRVIRGGSWGYGARVCRVSSRSYYAPGYRHIIVGFRLVSP